MPSASSTRSSRMPYGARWREAVREPRDAPPATSGATRQAQLVDEPGGDQLAVERRAALAQHDAAPRAAERGERLQDVDAVVARDHDLGDVGQRGAARSRRVARW